MHLSMVSPRVGGGGATHGKLTGYSFMLWKNNQLTQRAFPWAGILTQSWEFDMPATLEDLENLEMTYIVFAILVLKRLLFLPGGGTPGNSWYPISDQKVSFSRPGL